jgi:hypothetical protein
VEVTLRVYFPSEVQVGPDRFPNPSCTSGNPYRNSANIDLVAPALNLRKSLGALGHFCGAAWLTTFDDVPGISVEASDMGTSRRFAFQAGDTLMFLTDQNKLEAVDLPCGRSTLFRFEGAKIGARRKRFLREADALAGTTSAHMPPPGPYHIDLGWGRVNIDVEDHECSARYEATWHYTTNETGRYRCAPEAGETVELACVPPCSDKVAGRFVTEFGDGGLRWAFARESTGFNPPGKGPKMITLLPGHAAR